VGSAQAAEELYVPDRHAGSARVRGRQCPGAGRKAGCDVRAILPWPKPPARASNVCLTVGAYCSLTVCSFSPPDFETDRL
jgi:hypothetical protein